MSEFDDIRPYNDDEVDGVLANLLANKDFLEFIAKFKLPRLNAVLPKFATFLVRTVLARQVRKVHSIKDFQTAVASYARKLVQETMHGFRYSGLEHLDPDKSYLYVGNHRDIAGDSMLVDYALFLAGRETVRIAVGDNLVQRQFATDLMKLNKSFLIRRSETGAKKIYAALLESSRYIHASIATQNSIWIAHSEGRAKDGIDLTDPALVKMLALAERKQNIGITVKNLRIVPVSIAYEYDPCDQLKARELHSLNSTGSYNKAPGEDLLSLVKGLGEFKGKVTLRFGTPLVEQFEIAEQVASEIDRQILNGLQLYQINYWALEKVSKDEPTQAEAAAGISNHYKTVWQQVAHLADLESQSVLTERFDSCPEQYQLEWLQMYANPIVNKVNHGSANLTPD